jgi:hypothetical protein
LPSYPSYETVAKAKGYNWKAIVFWGIIAGLILFALYWYQEPILLFFQSLPNRISSFQMPDLNGFSAGIIKYINENPISVIVGGVSLCTAAVTLISKIRADRAKNAALVEKAQLEELATQKIQLAQSQSLELKNQLEEALADNSKEALIETQQLMQQQKTEFESSIKTLERELQKSREQLKNTPVKIVKVRD